MKYLVAYGIACEYDADRVIARVIGTPLEPYVALGKAQAASPVTLELLASCRGNWRTKEKVDEVIRESSDLLHGEWYEVPRKVLVGALGGKQLAQRGANEYGAEIVQDVMMAKKLAERGLPVNFSITGDHILCARDLGVELPLPGEQ